MIKKTLFFFLLILILILIITINDKIVLTKSKKKSLSLLKKTYKKVNNILRQAQLEAKTKIFETELNLEKKLKNKYSNLRNYENKLIDREQMMNIRDNNLIIKDKELLKKEILLKSLKLKLDKKKKKIINIEEKQILELSKICKISPKSAKSKLFSIIKKKIRNDEIEYLMEHEKLIKIKADKIAKNIISFAISRYSQEIISHNTTSVINLKNEEMKGRIIGKEGRNIRAFENVSGVDLLVNDNSDDITISSFNPIRREIAKIALKKLLLDGRIQPLRIEEIIKREKKNFYINIKKVGRNTILNLGINKIDDAIINILGKLKYRYSYGQNILQHSIDVAFLAGIMAVELGLNQKLAQRAGLLHDIGKGMDFEVEGSHIDLGTRLAKKYNENSVVVNAIASHHENSTIQPNNPISVLVIAADSLSATRPGARLASFEKYIQRLEDLETIALEEKGVSKAFALSAGRELRVMVMPNKINDFEAFRLSRKIKKKIEKKMSYPGQIKIIVIRELRATETAK